jgi:peptidoglycan/xylan/chitin deacetylase (PgdA/CDA1 family)
MSNQLFIAMYHYVRPIQGSRFPRVRGLELGDFRVQLEHFSRKYAVVSMERVIAACQGLEALPPKALLLSFDDGYSDHFSHVLPLLHDRGWEGSFYIPACAPRQSEVLEVNMIQFVLQCCPSIAQLVQELDVQLTAHAHEYELHSVEHYHREYEKPTRFDDGPTTYFKRLLQVVLPAELRTKLAREAFFRWVTRDELAFAQELYCSIDQIKTMRRCGMHIGGHGGDHRWLAGRPRDEQSAEIRHSTVFLDSVGVPRRRRSFCYPSGSYDGLTLELLREADFEIGLTTEVGSAKCSPLTALEMPRYDTNDFHPRGAM